jgi:hypothetical protein
MNETTDNFWKAFANFPPEPKPVFFRLYYNDDGTPICYSMEHLPGNYIELDAITYQRSPPNVRVVNGRMVEIKVSDITHKLVPSTQGIACDSRDVCVVDPDAKNKTIWKLKSYENN